MDCNVPRASSASQSRDRNARRLKPLLVVSAGNSNEPARSIVFSGAKWDVQPISPQQAELQNHRVHRHTSFASFFHCQPATTTTAVALPGSARRLGIVLLPPSSARVVHAQPLVGWDSQCTRNFQLEGGSWLRFGQLLGADVGLGLGGRVNDPYPPLPLQPLQRLVWLKH